MIQIPITFLGICIQEKYKKASFRLGYSEVSKDPTPMSNLSFSFEHVHTPQPGKHTQALFMYCVNIAESCSSKDECSEMVCSDFCVDTHGIPRKTSLKTSVYNISMHRCFKPEKLSDKNPKSARGFCNLFRSNTHLLIISKVRVVQKLSTRGPCLTFRPPWLGRQEDEQFRRTGTNRSWKRGRGESRRVFY